MKPTKFFLLAGLALALVAGGCTLNIGGTKTVDEATTGGLFQSADNGLTWRQLGRIATVGGKQPVFFDQDTISLVPDPTDNKTIYFGALAGGLFVTNDTGASWLPVRALGQRPVGDVAVNPTYRCTLYAASLNKIFKTIDCGRSWKESYADTTASALVYSLAIDKSNPDILYFANMRGDVIKSVDGGATWRTMKNFGSKLVKIVMDPANPRLLFAATEKKGLFKSTDGGATWQDLTPNLKAIDAGKKFKDLAPSRKQAGLYFLAVNDGLFKTANYGEDWTQIKIIPPENNSDIKALALSAKNAAKIYYITRAAIYATTDGGEHWSSHKLPTPRQGYALAVDAVNDSIIYLGVRK